MKKHLNNSNMIRRLIYVLAITSIITGLSMAKYQSIYSPSAAALIAKWSIQVNDNDITGEGTTLSNVITLVPDESTNVVNGKLAPGYGGYFDVIIDPTGTEVSFNYQINLNTSNLPTDIVLVGYNIGTEGTKDTATAITDNTITGNMQLQNNTPFTNADVRTIRVYWMWNDIRDNDATHTDTAMGDATYSVGVEVIVTQVV